MLIHVNINQCRDFSASSLTFYGTNLVHHDSVNLLSSASSSHHPLTLNSLTFTPSLLSFDTLWHGEEPDRSRRTERFPLTEMAEWHGEQSLGTEEKDGDEDSEEGRLWREQL